MIIESGQVAVVTGAARGLGYALASALASRDLAVVLADVERDQLNSAAEALTARGGRVLAVTTDVSDPDSVAELARTARDRFGQVDLLVNNAGITGRPGPVWETQLDDWNQVIGVNLLGVVHGIRAFVPRMLETGHGHIVNTASLAGLTASPSGSAYGATKHAVVAITETLRQDLDMAGASSIGTSVVCPGFIRTRLTSQILDADADLDTPAQAGAEQWRALVDAAKSHAIDADLAAQRVLAGVERNQLHILTNGDFMGAARNRAETVLAALD